jgi:membrane fusion protein (multidrug efflux system)
MAGGVSFCSSPFHGAHLLMNPLSLLPSEATRPLRAFAFATLCVLGLTLSACSHKEDANSRTSVEVTVMTVEPKDRPQRTEYVGQTESSRLVEIRARVNGYLEKRLYTEGRLVKEGAPLFLIDPRQYEADLQGAKAQLAQHEAQLRNARANLARVKPLAEEKALSPKDLDDAVHQEQDAAATVLAAQATVRQQQLNVGYTRIVSPVSGQTSAARQQEGSYIDSSNNLLTTVAALQPMRVNFNISENQLLTVRREAESGHLVLPELGKLVVRIILSDGTEFPETGRITFSDATFNSQTGTNLIRAELPNKEGTLKPGQFVRVHVEGGVIPKAIVVPQRAVLQTAQGNIVFVIGADNKAQPQPVRLGELDQDQWIITQGLKGGERVVVDGVVKLSPGAAVKIVEPQPAKPAATDNGADSSSPAPASK